MTSSGHVTHGGGSFYARPFHSAKEIFQILPVGKHLNFSRFKRRAAPNALLYGRTLMELLMTWTLMTCDQQPAAIFASSLSPTSPLLCETCDLIMRPRPWWTGRLSRLSSDSNNRSSHLWIWSSFFEQMYLVLTVVSTGTRNIFSFGRSREARCVAARPLRLILLTLLTKIDTAHNRWRCDVTLQASNDQQKQRDDTDSSAGDGASHPTANERPAPENPSLVNSWTMPAVTKCKQDKNNRLLWPLSPNKPPCKSHEIEFFQMAFIHQFMQIKLLEYVGVNMQTNGNGMIRPFLNPWLNPA